MKERLLLLFFVLSFNLMFSQNFADQKNAIQLENKSEYILPQLYGPGDEKNEIASLQCYKGKFIETNSAWFIWKVTKSGSLGFTLTPFDEMDDLDFVVYKIDAENFSEIKTEVRCMASGENLYSIDNINNSCLGETGLKTTSSDVIEQKGCNTQDDNFLKVLNVKAGENYLLFVNNFSSSSGFKLSWDGSADIGKLEGLDLSLNIFPNPVIKNCWVKIKSPTNSISQIRICGMLGNVVFERQIPLHKGIQKIELDLNGLTSGSYILELRTQDFIKSKSFVLTSKN